ncbi:MAG: hypothetical protein V4696_01620 [Pseudomonadota bacterium]
MNRPWIESAMLERIVPTRDLINKLGEYYNAEPIARIPPIETQPVGLNPHAWPPCKCCGGNVNQCTNYDPDTSAPLWGKKEGAR